MIDFHNHILPDVDDGAKTIEESILMLRYAEEQGITEVVNTTHFQHPKMHGKNTNFNYISSIRDDLVNKMIQENINIEIHLGAEVFFNFNLLDILKNELVTFCNGKYMLVEFQTHQFPKDFDKHIFSLLMSGVVPIIAHPERYRPIQKDIGIIEKLIKSGCLIQIDAGSILGHFGEKSKDVSERMLDRDMVHIMGSDSHGVGKRNFCLAQAVKIIRDMIGEKVDSLIYDNPKKVIKGEIIKIPKISPPSKNKNILSKIINKLIN